MGEVETERGRKVTRTAQALLQFRARNAAGGKVKQRLWTEWWAAVEGKIPDEWTDAGVSSHFARSAFLIRFCHRRLQEISCPSP